MKVEIWIRGRLLGEFERDIVALEYLESIIKKAEYVIIKRKEDGKELWLI
jgi:hypothetical protein